MPELLTLTCEAAEQAKSLGLTEDEVVVMVRKSAMYTSKTTNRRFEEYVFAVKANMVIAVYTLSPLSQRRHTATTNA